MMTRVIPGCFENTLLNPKPPQRKSKNIFAEKFFLLLPFFSFGRQIVSQVSNTNLKMEVVMKKMFVCTCWLWLMMSFCFGQLSDISESNAQNITPKVCGRQVQSGSWMNEFCFNVFVQPGKLKSQNAFTVYVKVTKPNGFEQLFQLDPVKARPNYENIWYSCVLLFTELGTYRLQYFVKNQIGTVFKCPKNYEFEVFWCIESGWFYPDSLSKPKVRTDLKKFLLFPLIGYKS